MMKRMIIILIFLVCAACQPCQPTAPRTWTMQKTVIYEVPGEGAYFPATATMPAVIIVRDINDPQVIPHEAGHAVWAASNVLTNVTGIDWTKLKVNDYLVNNSLEYDIFGSPAKITALDSGAGTITVDRFPARSYSNIILNDGCLYRATL